MGRPARIRLPPVWGVLGVIGLAVTVTGVLPGDDTLDVLSRTAPILGFLLAVTVLAELASASGLFVLVGEEAAAFSHRLGGGRVLVLFLAVCGVATALTIGLSLDTTAVLFTPVVIALCRSTCVPVLPFVFATVTLANTASLLLPVSNLTNLLAAERLGLGPVAFAAATAVPATVAVVATVAVLAIGHRRGLRGRFEAPARTPVPDRALVTIAAAAVLGFLVLVILEVPLWAAATGCALLLCLGFLRRRPDAVRAIPVPWKLVISLTGMFLLVAAAAHHGLLDPLRDFAGGTGPGGTGLDDLVRLAGTGAGLSNVANNIPAYLAVEPAVGSGSADGIRTVALLIGVNVGPLVTPWASLATLLWWERLRSAGITVTPRRFVVVGAPIAVIAGGAAVMALALTS